MPFLYGGVVGRMHWLTERQFLDAVAVAMITPGPVVITVAFIDAYSNLVQQAGGTFAGGNAAGDAPRQTYRVTTATQLRSASGGHGQVMRNLQPGALVYPTGEREGMYWKVTDENENEGWINNDNVAPAH